MQKHKRAHIHLQAHVTTRCRSYEQCIEWDLQPPWCSLTKNFDADGKRGDCLAHAVKPPRVGNTLPPPPPPDAHTQCVTVGTSFPFVVPLSEFCCARNHLSRFCTPARASLLLVHPPLVTPRPHALLSSLYCTSVTPVGWQRHVYTCLSARYSCPHLFYGFPPYAAQNTERQGDAVLTCTEFPNMVIADIVFARCDYLFVLCTIPRGICSGVVPAQISTYGTCACEWVCVHCSAAGWIDAYVCLRSDVCVAVSLSCIALLCICLPVGVCAYVCHWSVTCRCTSFCVVYCL